MKRTRTFVKTVIELENSLTLGVISTTGEAKSITCPKQGNNPLALLGTSINIGYNAAEEAVAITIEPGVWAYFPPEKMVGSVELPDLSYLRSQNRSHLAIAQALPSPFTAAGVQLPTGDVVGFQPGADLSQVLGKTCLWTLGEESETQAIAELAPEHFWIEQISEFQDGPLNVILTSGTPGSGVSVTVESEESLRQQLGVRQITSDLIGEAVFCKDEGLELLPGHRRGVPDPYFSVSGKVLDPNTLWHYAEVLNLTHVLFWGKIWKLKEPLPAVAGDDIIVTASDLVLEIGN